MLDSEMKEKIKEFAIVNRIEHGKAHPKFVFSAFMREFKNKIDKKMIKEYIKDVENICNIVNSLSAEEMEKYKNIFQQKKKEKTKELRLNDLVSSLKELPNVRDRVITRFEPSPSGPLHLGHVFPLLINYWYARKYDGEMILRIADTNPKNIDPEAYEMIVEDVEYLTGHFFEPVIQSSRIRLYYKVIEQLLVKGFAYVCLCSQEEFKRYIKESKPCPHREQPYQKNLELWERMLNGEFREGEAVVRIKTLIDHKNPAVREWVAFRIVEDEHPLLGKEYKVYPTMNFSVSVDDHLNGITHVIRGKDHEINTLRQLYIYEYMNWQPPEFIHIGRVNFEDLKLSTTETRKLIEDGVYSGWDDVRLPFIRSFKKKGFRGDAFSYWVLQIGLTKRDKKTSYNEFIKNFVKIHRVLIDKESIRMFFVLNPVEIKLINLDESVRVELENHPDVNLGKRFLYIGKNHPYVYVDMKDWGDIEYGECLRFKKFFTIRKIGNNEGEIVKSSCEKVVQFVPKEMSIDARIIMPDGNEVVGKVESNILRISPGKRLQFERFGFVKLDEIIKENLYICAKLYYIHE